MIQFDEDKQNRRLDDLRKSEEEELAQIISARHNLPYIDLSQIPISMEALKTIDEKTAREASLAPFSLMDQHLKIAILSPVSENTQMALKELERKGYENSIFITSTPSLVKAWDKYKEINNAKETSSGSVNISSEDIINTIKSSPTLEDIQKTTNELLKNKAGFKTSKILEFVIAGALATDASDIHIEPEEDKARVRYRLDGVLHDVVNVDLGTFALVLSRIKLISGLKLNIKKDSQDGRFSIKLPEGDIEVRTSILPGAYNESIVLRLLNPKSISVPLEKLGISKFLLDILLKEIMRPEGMVLTTGPTGSGKTTTLYAFMKKIHTPDVKIITIEDPIEYHLPGIVQTQVNDQGYTFIDGLRAALRQDPEVIMVGEIRDSDTAQIAINSSQTGHLVFSTLHTNSAAGSFPRLIDLGVNPNVLTSAINVVIAQRLVRLLCNNCKKSVDIEKADMDIIVKVLNDTPDTVEISQREKMWVAVGCDKCNNTGYKSRIGIHEAILVKGTGLDDLISRSASEKEIAEAVKIQKIPTLVQDGIAKVLAGDTSLEELRRVIDVQ